MGFIIPWIPFVRAVPRNGKSLITFFLVYHQFFPGAFNPVAVAIINSNNADNLKDLHTTEGYTVDLCCFYKFNSCFWACS
jgi:hypothetical protein